MHRHHIPRLALVIATFLVGSLAACGGEADSEDSGADAFCAALAALDEIESSDSESETDPFVDGLVTLDDAAPDEIADDTATVRRVIERSAEINELAPEEQEAAVAEFASQQEAFDTATKNIEDYARSNCPDLDESFFDS